MDDDRFAGLRCLGHVRDLSALWVQLPYGWSGGDLGLAVGRCWHPVYNQDCQSSSTRTRSPPKAASGPHTATLRTLGSARPPASARSSPLVVLKGSGTSGAVDIYSRICYNGVKLAQRCSQFFAARWKNESVPKVWASPWIPSLKLHYALVLTAPGLDLQAVWREQAVHPRVGPPAEVLCHQRTQGEVCEYRMTPMAA